MSLRSHRDPPGARRRSRFNPLLTAIFPRGSGASRASRASSAWRVTGLLPAWASGKTSSASPARPSEGATIRRPEFQCLALEWGICGITAGMSTPAPTRSGRPPLIGRPCSLRGHRTSLPRLSCGSAVPDGEPLLAGGSLAPRTPYCAPLPVAVGTACDRAHMTCDVVSSHERRQLHRASSVNKSQTAVSVDRRSLQLCAEYSMRVSLLPVCR